MIPALVSKITGITDKFPDTNFTVISPLETTTGLFTVDKKWTVTSWNEAAEKL